MSLVRKPTTEEATAARAAGAGSPEQAAIRVRNLFSRDLEDALTAQRKIRTLVVRHGRAAVEAALGDDGAELGTVYGALKTYIETLDGTADIPDLPT